MHVCSRSLLPTVPPPCHHLTLQPPRRLKRLQPDVVVAVMQAAKKLQSKRKRLRGKARLLTDDTSSPTALKREGAPADGASRSGRGGALRWAGERGRSKVRPTGAQNVCDSESIHLVLSLAFAKGAWLQKRLRGSPISRSSPRADRGRRASCKRCRSVAPIFLQIRALGGRLRSMFAPPSPRVNQHRSSSLLRERVGERERDITTYIAVVLVADGLDGGATQREIALALDPAAERGEDERVGGSSHKKVRAAAG